MNWEENIYIAIKEFDEGVLHFNLTSKDLYNV